MCVSSGFGFWNTLNILISFKRIIWRPWFLFSKNFSLSHLYSGEYLSKGLSGVVPQFSLSGGGELIIMPNNQYGKIHVFISSQIHSNDDKKS